MIKIHKKLWAIINRNRDNNLAYMTYYEDNAAFEKRKATGVSWAKEWYKGSKTGKELPVMENSPIAGFVISDVAHRWSTQNKVFRVMDPRGFTVEVPSGNIPQILSTTTVVNGVIQEPCVWGREGNNHILLSVGSEPYLEAIEQTKQTDTRIGIAKLEPGQYFKEKADDSEKCEAQYLGKVKGSWIVTERRAVEQATTNTFWGDIRYTRNHSDPVVGEPETLKDDKWLHLYRYKTEWSEKWCYTIVSSKKVIPLDKINKVNRNVVLNLGIPDRVQKKSTKCPDYREYHYSSSTTQKYFTITFKEVEWKD